MEVKHEKASNNDFLDYGSIAGLGRLHIGQPCYKQCPSTVVVWYFYLILQGH